MTNTMTKADKYTIVLRRHEEDSESDKYSRVESFEELRDAILFLNKTQRAFEYGDILYLCDTAEITRLDEKCLCLYVVDADRVAKISPPHSLYQNRLTPDLLQNHFKTAEDVIWFVAKEGVPKTELMKCVLACFEYVHGKENTEKTKKLKHIASEYAFGRTSVAELREQCGDLFLSFSREDYDNGVYALRFCIEISYVDYFAAKAYDSILSMLGSSNNENNEDLKQELRELVMGIIPLRMILLARAGCLR